MGGEEAFYSPMIRSHPSSEPVLLDCELHRYFSGFFPSLLKRDSMARGLEVGISLLPRQWGPANPSRSGSG